MLNARRNMNSLPCIERYGFPAELECGRAFDNVEELPGTSMEVLHLASARGTRA
jgi:hypothetical protein